MKNVEPETTGWLKRSKKDKNNRIDFMASDRVINPVHRDWFSKILFSVSVIMCVTGITTMGGVFRSNVVFAEGLDPIKQSIIILQKGMVDLQEDNKQTKRLIIQGRILDYEADIRELKVTSTQRTLDPTETQRLLRFEADLKHLRDSYENI